MNYLIRVFKPEVIVLYRFIHIILLMTRPRTRIEHTDISGHATWSVQWLRTIPTPSLRLPFPRSFEPHGIPPSPGSLCHWSGSEGILIAGR